MGFNPCKTEQPLQSIELKEKEEKEVDRGTAYKEPKNKSFLLTPDIKKCQTIFQTNVANRPFVSFLSTITLYLPYLR